MNEIFYQLSIWNVPLFCIVLFFCGGGMFFLFWKGKNLSKTELYSIWILPDFRHWMQNLHVNSSDVLVLFFLRFSYLILSSYLSLFVFVDVFALVSFVFVSNFISWFKTFSYTDVLGVILYMNHTWCCLTSCCRGAGKYVVTMCIPSLAVVSFSFVHSWCPVTLF